MTTETLTDKQKISYFAEFMRWKKQGNMWVNDTGEQVAWCFYATDWTGGRHDPWNPLTDWNHWRQVEEKIVENQNLLEAFITALGTPKDATPYIATGYLLAVGLPTRCTALIQAHSSLLHGE